LEEEREREKEEKKQGEKEIGGRVKETGRAPDKGEQRRRESREEGQAGFSKGVYAKSENCRGLIVKQNFPLI
jgi:hypothetical protein